MRDFSREDREQRERLERQSSSAPRVDRVGCLNKMAAGAASREMAGLAAYVLLRGVQAHGRDVERLNAKHDRLLNTGRLEVGERLDRIHPGSPMAAEPDRIDRRQLAAAELRRRYW